MVNRIPWHSWVRWSLVVILALGGLTIALLSATNHGFQVCEDLVARVGTKPAVRSCRPLGATDAPFLVGLLLVVLLLMPDFTRISIVGFVELERKVTVQEEKTRTLETQVIALQTVQASASARVIHAENLFLRESDDPESVLNSIEDKRREFDG